MNEQIQDTLIKINDRVLQNDYQPNELIDFSGSCTIIERNIGPWIFHTQIKDTINNKIVSIPVNSPMPYIVYKNNLYYPCEQNLFVLGFKPHSLFKKISFK